MQKTVFQDSTTNAPRNSNRKIWPAGRAHGQCGAGLCSLRLLPGRVPHLSGTRPGNGFAAGTNRAHERGARRKTFVERRPASYRSLLGLPGVRTGLPERRSLSRFDQPVSRPGERSFSSFRRRKVFALDVRRTPIPFPTRFRLAAVLGRDWKSLRPAASRLPQADAGAAAGQTPGPAGLARCRRQPKANDAHASRCSRDAPSRCSIRTSTRPPSRCSRAMASRSIVPDAQGCCGGLAWHTGELAAARHSPGGISTPFPRTWMRFSPTPRDAVRRCTNIISSCAARRMKSALTNSANACSM